MLEVHWPYIGWDLQCLRTPVPNRPPEVIRKVFERLRDLPGRDLIASLLRPTSVPATSLEVRNAYRALADARKQLGDTQSAYNAQAASCEEAGRAVHQASPEHRRSLQEEITRRIASRIKLQAECQTKQSLLTAAEKRIPKGEPPLGQPAKIEISALRTEYEKPKQALETEERILRDLKKQHDAATTQHWIQAREIEAKRTAKLKELAAELREFGKGLRRLETLFDDQAAGFAQQDFMNFMIDRRSRLQPRQLAKALAGLPLIPCRESFKQCREFPFPADPYINYELFEVINRAWAKHDPAVVDLNLHQRLFEEEIDRLPKTRPWNGTKVPNWVREKFESNRRELNRAIQECWTLGPLPGQVPYIITAKFLENISQQQQRTALERVLSDSSEGR